MATGDIQFRPSFFDGSPHLGDARAFARVCEPASPPDPDAPFEAAIDAALADGRDPAPERLVYADALDERNTAADARRAAAQRWMAAKRLQPLATDRGDHVWGLSSPPGGVRRRTHSMLPNRVANRILGGAWVAPRYWSFPTRRAAEDALADALAAAGVT